MIDKKINLFHHISTNFFTISINAILISVLVLTSCSNEDPKKGENVETRPLTQVESDTRSEEKKNEVMKKIVVEETKERGKTEKKAPIEMKQGSKNNSSVTSSSNTVVDIPSTEAHNKEQLSKIESFSNNEKSKFEEQEAKAIDEKDEQKSEFLGKSKKMSKDFDDIFNELDKEEE